MISGREESPEEETSDTVMPPLCAVLVLFQQSLWSAWEEHSSASRAYDSSAWRHCDCPMFLC
uniref:Uncharacterized protein n=1 Tax=Anguilla anguilla TaxID=7936 RepID=A0A0E9R8Y3_ANGAN